ncbi:hypothetical protein ANO11243_071490 [Dothideomycetidae sp. 11243]|nr:hypothetical protein ANO11243_071490 [fungal sp. No.11243]
MSEVQYKKVLVDSVNIFYREAGSPSLPTLLLLHGHGSASHVFRGLIPLLSSSFHLIAPDYPGFGQSDMPSRQDYKYTFVNIANTIDKFTEKIGLAEKKFAIYVFDYGAPVGFMIAVKHPERITGIVSQSGNAYEDGLSENLAVMKAYWAAPEDQSLREKLREAMFDPKEIKQGYINGAQSPESVNPDNAILDTYYNLGRPGALEIQLDLLLDYGENVKVYPQWQEYLRKHQPKLVAIWGKHDPFFIPPGAEAFKRDLPDAYVEIADAGHYVNDQIPERVAAVAKKLLSK